MDDPDNSASWDDQLRRLFDDLARPDSRPDPAMVRRLWGFMLAATETPLPSAEADDAAGTVLMALMARLRSNPDPIEHPAAYLRTAVRNAMTSKTVARRSDYPVDPGEARELADEPEDSSARPAREIVNRAFEMASRAGDSQAVQVAITWLDLDDERQRPPSTRSIAAELGVSHTTVERVLERLRRYAEQAVNDNP